MCQTDRADGDPKRKRGSLSSRPSYHMDRSVQQGEAFRRFTTGSDRALHPRPLEYPLQFHTIQQLVRVKVLFYGCFQGLEYPCPLLHLVLRR